MIVKLAELTYKASNPEV